MATPSVWISAEEAAKILGVSRSTVYRSLVDAETADKKWGAGNWRRKPLTDRRELQVRRERVHEVAASAHALDEPGD